MADNFLENITKSTNNSKAEWLRKKRHLQIKKVRNIRNQTMRHYKNHNGKMKQTLFRLPFFCLAHHLHYKPNKVHT